jgi:hypothetical protein
MVYSTYRINSRRHELTSIWEQAENDPDKDTLDYIPWEELSSEDKIELLEDRVDTYRGYLAVVVRATGGYIDLPNALVEDTDEDKLEIVHKQNRTVLKYEEE